jgi:hypothetical protein
LEVPKAPEAPNEGVDLSTAEADRRAYEQSAEYEDAILHAEAGTELQAAQATTARPAHPSAGIAESQAAKDEVVIEVEKILEEGIGPFYASLPPEAKPVFKKRGEDVAAQIAEMVRSMHLHVRRAVRLIADWLRTIPGINKFFLEQEAKIKADMLKQLVEARKEDAERNV